MGHVGPTFTFNKKKRKEKNNKTKVYDQFSWAEGKTDVRF